MSALVTLSLDPRFIEVYLQNYHEFTESQDLDSKLILWDVMVAYWTAPLTIEERSVLQRLYLDPPKSPERSGKAGRPSGGTTLKSVDYTGPRGGTSKDTINNLKKSAIDKIAEFLGREYGVG